MYQSLQGLNHVVFGDEAIEVLVELSEGIFSVQLLFYNPVFYFLNHLFLPKERILDNRHLRDFRGDHGLQQIFKPPKINHAHSICVHYQEELLQQRCRNFRGSLDAFYELSLVYEPDILSIASFEKVCAKYFLRPHYLSYIFQNGYDFLVRYFSFSDLVSALLIEALEIAVLQASFEVLRRNFAVVIDIHLNDELVDLHKVSSFVHLGFQEVYKLVGRNKFGLRATQPCEE